MKIYFFPTSYPDETHPTKNIFIYEQAKALSKLGHEIIVLHVQKQSTADLLKPIERSIRFHDDGFVKRYSVESHTFFENKYDAINCSHFVNKMTNLYKYAVSKEGKPDVIYAHFSFFAGYVAVKIGEQYSIPVMVLEHFSGLMTGRISKYKTKILKQVVSNADGFACVSDGLRKAIIEATGETRELEVIGNMINPMFQYSDPAKKDEFVFFALGRLSPPKKYDSLISAFCKAFSSEDNVKLLIAGTGELKESIEKQISDNNRKSQIILLGSLSRAEILTQYQNCDCFALASGYETFGMVWREAMAVGRPIITTDHGGFDIWKDSWGIKVPVGDIDSLSNALIEMRKNISNYEGKDISDNCISTYGSEYISHRVEQSLLMAIDHKKGKLR